MLAVFFMGVFSCKKDILTVSEVDSQVPFPILPYSSCHGGNVSNDDYLHEERFVSCDSTVIFDHEITPKFEAFTLPVYNDSIYLLGERDYLTTDQMNITITDPATNNSATFNNIFGWSYDHPEEHVFNLNKKLHELWGYNQGSHSFTITFTHTPTARVTDFNHDEIILYFDGF